MERVESADRAFNEALRALKARFASDIEVHRAALFAYCRHLTGEAFSAEDLHQETVLRAFARLSERFEPLRHPRAYLFRAATRIWLDGRKRRREVLVSEPEELADRSPAPVSRREVEEALARLIRHLPPRELAALLLRDVYEFSGAEAAAILGVSEAAVKMAVVRARRRVRALPAEAEAEHETGPAADLLGRFVDAFRAHDAAALAALIAEHAVARALGCAEEQGRDEILRGTLRYALQRTDWVRCSVERYRGQWIVAFWYRGDDATVAVADLMRVEAEDDAIVSLTLHWFSPDLLRSVGDALGLPIATHGYGPPTGASWWNHLG